MMELGRLTRDSLTSSVALVIMIRNDRDVCNLQNILLLNHHIWRYMIIRFIPKPENCSDARAIPWRQSMHRVSSAVNTNL